MVCTGQCTAAVLQSRPAKHVWHQLVSTSSVHHVQHRRLLTLRGQAGGHIISLIGRAPQTPCFHAGYMQSDN
jgi:hypothetical protein